MNNSDKLISIQQASEMLCVSKWTLRRYPQDILQVYFTQGNHRRYRLLDIQKLIGSNSRTDINNVAVYVRVSSQDQKQKGDLDRQKARVLEYCVRSKYTVTHVLDEVGSGLNDNRKKFHKLLELVTTKQISKVVIEHKDRLTRFNFEILKLLFKGFGVGIEILEVELNKTFEEELVSDMISLMSSFSARLYGKRSSKNKAKNNENNKKQ